jgi:hypothetical protein
MAYLLVDDTDGRVLGEFESGERALRLLERIRERHPQAAAGLCLVHFGEHVGSLSSVSSSVKLRLPPELPGAPGIPDLR